MSLEVNIGDWDMAIAMRYGEINARIARRIADERAKATAGDAAFPETLKLSKTTVLGVELSVDAQVDGAWKLIEGGADDKVMVGIRLTPATLGVGETSVNDAIVNLSIALSIVHDQTGDIRLAPNDPDNGLADYAYRYAPGGQRLGEDEQFQINGLLEEWVETLLPQFAVALTGIDKSIEPSKPAWGWLKPKAWRGSVVEFRGGDVDDFLVVIASMGTDSATPSDIMVSGPIVPLGSQVGIAINSRIVLGQMIQPTLPLLFDDAVPADFDVSSREITTSKSFTVAEARITPDEPPTPITFRDFRVKVEGSTLSYSSNLNFTHKDLTVSSDFGAVMTLSLGSRAVTVDGATATIPFVDHHVVFQEATDTTITISAGLDTGFKIAGIAVIILGFVAAFGGVVLDGETPPEETSRISEGDTESISLSDVSSNDPSMSEETESEVEAELAARVEGSPPRLICGRTSATWIKGGVFGVLGALTGGGVMYIPALIQQGQELEVDQIEASLDDFLLEALTVIDLPGGVAKDYQLTSLSFDNALVVGASLRAPQS